MRMGGKKRPLYRVVVTDSRRFRDGQCIERLGSYNPVPENPDIKLNMDRVDYWIKRGAQPSDTVKSLIARIRKSAATVLS
jgi:small subunit ribosomal protein S16